MKQKKIRKNEAEMVQFDQMMILLRQGYGGQEGRMAKERLDAQKRLAAEVSQGILRKTEQERCRNGAIL